MLGVPLGMPRLSFGEPTRGVHALRLLQPALVRAARAEGDSDPVGFARAALDKAAQRHHQQLLDRSRGSWPTYNWSGTFDAESGVWQLHPEPEPDREPPGVDWRTRFAEQAVREGRLIEVRTSTDPNSGDGYLFTPDGSRVWGRFGAAGVLYRSRDSSGEPGICLDVSHDDELDRSDGRGGPFVRTRLF